MIKQSKRNIKKSKKSRKQNKRGGGCGVLNPRKTYSDNRRNCLRNKAAWGARGVKVNGVYPITCKRDQLEYTNFPSNVECTGDIMDKEFNPTEADDVYDTQNGLR
jgi:hypothetical protein